VEPVGSILIVFAQNTKLPEITTQVAILGLATCLWVAYNDSKLHLRLDLKDLRLDLGLEAWWLGTCTRAHFIHRSKTGVNRSEENALINNSEHLLLIVSSSKSYKFFRANSSTAMECLLSNDHNTHDWLTKHWATCLLEWIANFHWLGGYLFLILSSVFVCLLFCKD